MYDRPAIWASLLQTQQAKDGKRQFGRRKHREKTKQPLEKMFLFIKGHSSWFEDHRYLKFEIFSMFPSSNRQCESVCEFGEEVTLEKKSLLLARFDRQ